MAQTEESLLYYRTYPATAESQLTALLSLMVNDLRKKGSFSMETSGHYDRMSQQPCHVESQKQDFIKH